MKASPLVLSLTVIASVLATRLSAPDPAPPDPRALSASFQDLARGVAPAVVGIRAENRSGRRVSFAQGSGVILREDGIIVTNHHVIKNATSILVLLDEDEVRTAHVRGVDPETDLAVLEIEGRDYPTARLGGDDRPEVGEWVLAVGNPLGLGRAVTAGIVSALGRSLGIVDYEDFIQTDAAINFGNSGGALIDLDGRVVGINMAKGTPEAGSVGLGFAIPAHIVRDVVDEILLEGRMRRGWLGVAMKGISPASARELGLGQKRRVVITEVFRGGPAYEAGVRVDDIILRIGDHEPVDLPDLLLEVAGLDPGARVPLELWRNGARRSLAVYMGERSLGKAPAAAE